MLSNWIWSWQKKKLKPQNCSTFEILVLMLTCSSLFIKTIQYFLCNVEATKTDVKNRFTFIVHKFFVQSALASYLNLNPALLQYVHCISSVKNLGAYSCSHYNERRAISWLKNWLFAFILMTKNLHFVYMCCFHSKLILLKIIIEI